MKYHKTTKVDKNFLDILNVITNNIVTSNGKVVDKDYMLSITGIGAYKRNEITNEEILRLITSRDGASIVLTVYYERFLEVYGFVYFEGNIYSVNTNDLKATCKHISDKNKRDMVFCEYRGLKIFPKLEI